MNPTGKKLISLFLVFSLMMLSVNLYAKERRGAKLIIIKKNGLQERGELITVKKDSLLLLYAGRLDKSVGIEEIKVITIVKKSKTSLGGRIGVLVCGGAAVLIGYEIGRNRYFVNYSSLFAILGGVIGVLAGGLLGGFIGSSLGKDKTFQLEGITDSEIQETLNKLRKRARIRDYE